MKTNKSLSKRLKVTRTGKVLARVAGQNHFNAKESRVSQLAKKKNVGIKLSPKVMSLNLPHA
jgi:ribosomal protein L35